MTLLSTLAQEIKITQNPDTPDRNVTNVHLVIDLKRLLARDPNTYEGDALMGKDYLEEFAKLVREARDGSREMSEPCLISGSSA